MKKQHMTIISILIITSLIIGVILILDDEGFFEDSEYLANYPVFSNIDFKILGTSKSMYEELKETMSSSDARAQLLQSLNNEIAGVEQAERGVDGYTIFIDFSDGDFAAIDTFEIDEASNSSSATGFLSPGKTIKPKS